MFTLFKKKQPEPAEKNPIPLPEIPSNEINPVELFEMLNNGTAIWGWYKLTHQKNNTVNVSALHNMTIGFEGLAVFRREGNYLVKYRVDVIGEKYYICLKLSEICKLTRSNLMELYNTELTDAYKLFYDYDCSYSAACRCYAHNVTNDMIEQALSQRRVFHICDENFIKKDENNNT